MGTRDGATFGGLCCWGVRKVSGAVSVRIRPFTVSWRPGCDPGRMRQGLWRQRMRQRWAEVVLPTRHPHIFVICQAAV